MNPLTLALVGAGLTGFALGAFFSATGKQEMGVILMGLGLMFQVISLVRLKRAKTRDGGNAR